MRELSSPAWGLPIPSAEVEQHEYNITSMASSIQPRPPAMSDWRSATVIGRPPRPRIRRVAVCWSWHSFRRAIGAFNP